MNLIAAVDRDWGIGLQGKLLFHASADFARLKRLTNGKILVMGRKTYESLPVQPLPDRVHIVLSTAQKEYPAGIMLCNTIEQVHTALSRFPSHGVFVFGGQSVYEQFLLSCDRAYITQFYAARPHDASLPRLDQSPEWIRSHRSQPMQEDCEAFTFDIYQRIGSRAAKRSF